MSEYTGKKISTFKDRFSELCKSNPMNDSAIARALHVSRQTVHYWKIGERSPKQPTIIAIANWFGVDVAWLMGFDVKKTKASLNDPLYFYGKKLSKEDDEVLERLLDLLVKLSTTNRRMAKNILLGLMEGE